MSNISIIIPTEGDLNWKNQSIIYTLMSLTDQIGVEMEIIVVTTQPTDEFNNEMSIQHVQVVTTNDRFCGERRNLGATIANADKIIFIDDDTVLMDRDIVSKVCCMLDECDFACGAYRYWSSIYWHKYVSRLLCNSSNVTTLKNISILPRGINRVFGFRDLNEFTFIGNFGAIKKDIFLDVGMFSKEFRNYGFEDVDLMMRLCLHGMRSKLLCEQSIGVIHLTHPAKTDDDLSKNGLIFDRIQKERGYYFQANHFFGVYEGDGHAILIPCEQLHRMLG